MKTENLLLGTWVEIPTAYVVDIMSKAGLDFMIADMEHGIITFETVQNMVFAAHSRKKEIYVRVPAIEESWILRALDTGCDGIVFPQVTDADMVEKIVQYTYFAPLGNRGFNPYITACGYTGGDYTIFSKENSRIKTAVILEGKKAFEKIEEILKFPQIDVIYIGQYDLSVALGVAGDIESPIVLETMTNAVLKIRSAGKMAGCMVQSSLDAKRYLDLGFNFLVYKVDSGVLFYSVNEFVSEVKNEII